MNGLETESSRPFVLSGLLIAILADLRYLQGGDLDR